jgi:hypothetical protein
LKNLQSKIKAPFGAFLVYKLPFNDIV